MKRGLELSVAVASQILQMAGGDASMLTAMLATLLRFLKTTRPPSRWLVTPLEGEAPATLTPHYIFVPRNFPEKWSRVDAVFLHLSFREISQAIGLIVGVRVTGRERAYSPDPGIFDAYTIFVKGRPRSIQLSARPPLACDAACR